MLSLFFLTDSPMNAYFHSYFPFYYNNSLFSFFLPIIRLISYWVRRIDYSLAFLLLQYTYILHFFKYCLFLRTHSLINNLHNLKYHFLDGFESIIVIFIISLPLDTRITIFILSYVKKSLARECDWFSTKITDNIFWI